MAAPLIDISDLKVHIPTSQGLLHAVDGVSWSVQPGEIVGLVGESGCGKSITARTLMRLQPTRARVSGSILFEGRNILEMSGAEMRALRGRRISMIFQDPLSFLNPIMKIGRQLSEAIDLHLNLAPAAASRRMVEVLSKVGLPDAQRILSSYPHQLSGGMRQRVLIALAIITEPTLLIADEPTTALDVTIQAQILDLLATLCRDLGVTLILITHDLGVVAGYCDRVNVMYAGRIVESAPVEDLFHRPVHMYTRGLLASVVPIDRRLDRFQGIAGSVPSLISPAPGCRFAARCPSRQDRCTSANPPDIQLGPNRHAACILAEEGEASR